jgi:hypothetical protein
MVNSETRAELNDVCDQKVLGYSGDEERLNRSRRRDEQEKSE